MRLVSACLLGVPCRYSGKDSRNDKIIELYGKDAIPVCPEQLGGLPTPREPAEMVGEAVLTKSGENFTDYFRRGAELTLYIAKLSGATEAVLKQKSPSCGCGTVYDGTFTGKLAEGYGVTARLLKDNGIKVVPDDAA